MDAFQSIISFAPITINLILLAYFFGKSTAQLYELRERIASHEDSTKESQLKLHDEFCQKIEASNQLLEQKLISHKSVNDTIVSQTLQHLEKIDKNLQSMNVEIKQISDRLISLEQQKNAFSHNVHPFVPRAP